MTPAGTAQPLRRFPASERLLMHPAAGRGTRTVRTLAGASDWRRDLADRIGGAVVAVTGPEPWPAASPPWQWPSADHDEVAAALREMLPGLRLVGAVVPRQAGRPRLSLLCRYAGNLVVVKLGVDEPGASLRTEAHALSLLMRHPLPGIDTPEVLGSGTLALGETAEPIDFLATTGVGLGAQRAALDAPLRTFEPDLSERLEPLAPPVRSGLVAVHGDLTPWNLRRTRRGLALFDWEAAGWATAGADIEHYRAACDAVRPWWKRRPR